MVAKTKQQLEEIEERIRRVFPATSWGRRTHERRRALPPAGSLSDSLPRRQAVRAHRERDLSPETPSTNDVGEAIVEKMLAESEDIRPTVIVAGEQTAGHGRAGRSWTPLPGALAVSVIVPWPEGPGRVRLPVAPESSRAGLSRRRSAST